MQGAKTAGPDKRAKFIKVSNARKTSKTLLLGFGVVSFFLHKALNSTH
jgi:hypothetical protein